MSAKKFLLYSWEPTLPINIKLDLVDAERKAQWQTIFKETFDAVLSTAIFIREKVHQTSGENIPHAQAK